MRRYQLLSVVIVQGSPSAEHDVEGAAYAAAEAFSESDQGGSVVSGGSGGDSGASAGGASTVEIDLVTITMRPALQGLWIVDSATYNTKIKPAVGMTTAVAGSGTDVAGRVRAALRRRRLLARR